MKYVQDMNFTGKRVLARCDLDVPLQNGEIQNDTRLRELVPTLQKILETCSRLIILGHLGRPQQVDPSLSTKQLVPKLSELLGQTVTYVDFVVGKELPEEKIILLENVRFHPGEATNDPAFAQQLADYADVIVNEAFATGFRKHASITGILKFKRACAGLHFQTEMKHLTFNTKGKFVAILGGAKLSTKFGAINALATMTDKLLLGGAMIFTFYKAKGYEIGTSLLEPDQITTAKLLLNNPKIVLPVDVVIASDRNATEKTVVEPKAIPANKIGLDVGPDTVELFVDYVKGADVVFWNGPLGYVENDAFAAGTKEFAKMLSELSCTTVLGGGDTLAAIDKLGLREKFTHVSSAGGAALKFIQKKTLPVIKALDDNEVEFA